MNDKQKETYLNWLNDAYSMEKDIVNTLENQAGQVEHLPEVQNKINEHIEVTKKQAEQIKDCIERNGGSVSGIKSAMANVMGTAKGMSTGMADDKLVKNSIADFATENFEIASYIALIEAARMLGDEETATACEGILKEEEEMRDWVKQELPGTVKNHLASLS